MLEEKTKLTPEEVREIRAKISKLLLEPIITEDTALLIFKEPLTIRIMKLKEEEGKGYEVHLDYDTYIVYVYLDLNFEIKYHYVRERDLCAP
jgi:hypothetical protein